MDQFTSVFSIPDPQQIITDPVSLFAHEPNTGINKSLFLTDIMLNEAIHELSPNSAAGLDCVPSSLLDLSAAFDTIDHDNLFYIPFTSITI